MDCIPKVLDLNGSSRQAFITPAGVNAILVASMILQALCLTNGSNRMRTPVPFMRKITGLRNGCTLVKES